MVPKKSRPVVRSATIEPKTRLPPVRTCGKLAVPPTSYATPVSTAWVALVPVWSFRMSAALSRSEGLIGSTCTAPLMVPLIALTVSVPAVP